MCVYAHICVVMRVYAHKRVCMCVCALGVHVCVRAGACMRVYARACELIKKYKVTAHTRLAYCLYYVHNVREKYRMRAADISRNLQC